MTARGTAALLAVCGVLLAWLWFVERTAVREEAARPPAALLAPGVDVARVEVQDGERRLTAVRRNGRWVDGAGRAWPPGTVDTLLDVLRSLHPVMVVDPHPERAADYGLATPTRVEVTGRDGGALLALNVGARNPAGTNLYARTGEAAPVVLVGGVLAWELDKLRAAAP